MSGSSPSPIAHVRMIIRRPVAEVFRAITSPEYLTRFWLAHASGPLEPGKTVLWQFMVDGADADTTVTHFEQDRRLDIAWSDGTRVRWTLESRSDGGTVLDVVASGFGGTDEEKIELALESREAFTLVLSDLKALLETGKAIGCVHDKAVLIAEKHGVRVRARAPR